MENRVLGRTGLWVSSIGVGTGQFGAFGEPDHDACIRIAHIALDRGVNLIDTADFYSGGEAETIVGKAIADRREKVIVATKCGLPMSADPNESGASRRWIMRSVEASLRRLGTDYIDVYQMHRPDPNTDVMQTVETLDDLVRAGKIRYFGSSMFPAELLVEAQLRAQQGGRSGFHSEQTSYSIFNRLGEADVFPVCERMGLGVFAYSPLDSGWLSGKYRSGQVTEVSPRYRLMAGYFDLKQQLSQRKLEAVEKLSALAAEAGITLSHLAIGFVLAHSSVTSALVGGWKPAYIEEHLTRNEARLSDEVLDAIDAIVAPGTNINGTTRNYLSPALTDPTQRRRRA